MDEPNLPTNFDAGLVTVATVKWQRKSQHFSFVNLRWIGGRGWSSVLVDNICWENDAWSLHMPRLTPCSISRGGRRGGKGDYTLQTWMTTWILVWVIRLVSAVLVQWMVSPLTPLRHLMGGDKMPLGAHDHLHSLICLRLFVVRCEPGIYLH